MSRELILEHLGLGVYIVLLRVMSGPWNAPSSQGKSAALCVLRTTVLPILIHLSVSFKALHYCSLENTQTTKAALALKGTSCESALMTSAPGMLALLR